MAFFKKTKKLATSSQTPKAIDIAEERPEIAAKQPHIGDRGSSSAAWRILERPKVSEKATKLADHRQYIFLVNKKSTKPEIKSVIEEAYRVHVNRVNIVRIKGKKKEWRGRATKLPDIKKAIVTLREGDKIEIT